MNYNKLDFDTIIENVKQCALSAQAKQLLDSMKPSSDLTTVNKRLDETAEALDLLQKKLHIPFLALDSFVSVMKKVEMGYILMPNELLDYADFLRGLRQLKTFFQKWEHSAPILASYAKGLTTLEHVETQIYEKVNKTSVLSSADRALHKCRQQIEQINQEITKRLTKFLKHSSHKEYIQEFIIVEKNGRSAIPIKSAYKNKVHAKIIDESFKGLTVYVEPHSVTPLIDEKTELIQLEQQLEYKILSEITSLLYDNLQTHERNAEIIIQLDMIFARAKYALQYDGVRVSVNKMNHLQLVDAVHPLISNFVPLTVGLGTDKCGLMITGVNAGGKTVVLKTIGLLTLMTMYGLLITAHSSSQIAIMDHIFVSIGDNQSINHSLSTFSSELQTLAHILQFATEHSLVLLDEIGSGTDPKEGTALAIAVLNALYQRKLLLFATTHYSDVKDYAIRNPYFDTASMRFDEEQLTPLYQLMLNTVGDSRAFWIAEKMNVPKNIIEQAKTYLATGEINIPTIMLQKEHDKNSGAPDKKYPKFTKGDIVYVASMKKEALFYDYIENSPKVTVFIDKTFYDVPIHRLQLKRQAKDLYPQHYNLDLLFIQDYQVYKYQKDLQRGSKKAWKKYRKEKKTYD